jgi:hypothetical protein
MIYMHIKTSILALTYEILLEISTNMPHTLFVCYLKKKSKQHLHVDSTKHTHGYTNI